MKASDYSRKLTVMVTVVFFDIFCVSCSGLAAVGGTSSSANSDDDNSGSGASLSLSSLKVNDQTLSVKATKQSLSGILPFTTESIAVIATPADKASTVTVVGNSGLANMAGKITLSIIVMTQDGVSSRTYTVTAIKEGAALEYPLSPVITVSTFTVGGTCFGDMPDRVLVSFGCMAAVEAVLNPDTKAWSANVDATTLPNSPNRQLAVDTVWSKGTLHTTREYSLMR